MKRMITLLALLALPTAALAQTPEERIEAAKARAAAVGIPMALIEAKIADGKAKGVPMDRLAVAVERRAESLQQAQATLGTEATDGELGLGADALQLGVSEAVLLKLSETAGRERRGAAIAALTQLVAMEIAPAQALERVTAALALGDDALANLPEDAAAARVRRGPPAGVGRPAGTGGMPAGVPAPGQTATGRKPPIGRPIGS